MVVRTVALSRLQSSCGWSGTPRTVRSSTRHRPASPVSYCLAPCGPGTAWRSQAWDRSPSRLRQLLCLVLLVQAESPLSVLTSRVVVTTSSRTEFSDRIVFPYRASCSFASALPFVAAGRALGGGDGVVGEDPVASSVSLFPVYVTLGPFRLSGSVGGDRENRVLDVG
ncbi:hypothetical protein Taro_052865 [Colocasia esculenta]|uniref:Uncharacterized protein n=1 Tax=Colocasia esculenta TaxID=4460 RepID=A0A843XKY3_COLES|nr:hypothetical protein [Colocasia esculenta]